MHQAAHPVWMVPADWETLESGPIIQREMQQSSIPTQPKRAVTEKWQLTKQLGTFLRIALRILQCDNKAAQPKWIEAVQVV